MAVESSTQKDDALLRSRPQLGNYSWITKYDFGFTPLSQKLDYKDYFLTTVALTFIGGAIWNLFLNK